MPSGRFDDDVTTPADVATTLRFTVERQSPPKRWYPKIRVVNAPEMTDPRLGVVQIEGARRAGPVDEDWVAGGGQHLVARRHRE